MKDKILSFLKSAFSEKDGTASASRVLAGSTVASTLVWVSFIVFRTNALPDLSGAALFITAGFGGYGANKLAGAISGDKKS